MIEARHAGDFDFAGITPRGNLPGALRADAGDLVGQNGLMLRGATASTEQRVFILTTPFQNAILQRECRYAFYTSRVEAACNIVVVIVDAYDEVRLRVDHL